MALPLKLVNNSDAGDADHVGGNDWDDMANWVNSPYRDFNLTTIPADPASTAERVYAKVIDANNNGFFVKRKVNGTIVEVQL